MSARGVIMGDRKQHGLEEALKKIESRGITADRRHLLEDIGAQFADYREWIREYVVNAYDAGASHCRVWGEEEGDRITIFVQDDGRGMDRERVVDFMMLFRSVKDGDPRKAVGRFGVGKASILAIPGLIALSMETSTGQEGWKMDPCSLLDDRPVRIRRLDSPGSHGTTFAVSFKKRNSLGDELLRLGDILSRYVRYLPMTITVQNLAASHPGNPHFRYINDQWSAYRERVGRSYTFTVDHCSFEAILGLGNGSHEIYQNRVLVTNKYDLFFHDRNNCFSLPYISVRVDSPDFELPFGRHGLRNEEILMPLARYLRKTILPQYFDELQRECHDSRQGKASQVTLHELESIAVKMLPVDYGNHCAWNRLPMFNLWGQQRVSLNQLNEMVESSGRIYLEDADNPGADYTAFDGPVLLATQPEGGLNFLKGHFIERLVNLSDKNMVLEQSVTGERKLSSEELSFEAALGFHAETLACFDDLGHRSPDGPPEGFPGDPDVGEPLLAGLVSLEKLSNETRSARAELEDLEWRVNYLVERDGVTPCHRQKFLYTGSELVLNLYHPEIRKLLALSKKIPSLAGHWALAMCLQDRRKILVHLTPETREELIRIDALVRSHHVGGPPQKKRRPLRESEGDSFREYLRMLASQSGIPGDLIN